MRTAILALAALACASGAQAEGACAPAGLTKIVTTNITPGVQPGTFAAEPLVMYRSGSLLMRSEEGADPARNLHLLTVVHEPDIWMVNLADHTGQHMVDPGPSIDVHVPIFGTTPELMALEFGCEVEFARQHMGEPVAREGTVAVYRLAVGPGFVELKLAANGRPTQVGYLQDGQPKLLIRYDSYETGLPIDPRLFAKPDGVTYTEAKPGGG